MPFAPQLARDRFLDHDVRRRERLGEHLARVVALRGSAPRTRDAGP